MTHATETEAVQRVVFEARQFARADSHVDEQAWFDDGEPDTVPTVLVDPSIARPRPRPLLALTIAFYAAVIVAVGLTIGYELGHGW